MRTNAVRGGAVDAGGAVASLRTAVGFEGYSAATRPVGTADVAQTHRIAAHDGTNCAVDRTYRNRLFSPERFLAVGRIAGVHVSDKRRSVVCLRVGGHVGRSVGTVAVHHRISFFKRSCTIADFRFGMDRRRMVAVFSKNNLCKKRRSDGDFRRLRIYEKQNFVDIVRTFGLLRSNVLLPTSEAQVDRRLGNF